MGNICQRQIPNLSLSCANSGMISSCCKTEEAYEKSDVTLYKWMYSSSTYENPLDFELDESGVWFMTLEECNSSLVSHIALCNKLWACVHIYEWKVKASKKCELIYDNTFTSTLESEV